MHSLSPPPQHKLGKVQLQVNRASITEVTCKENTAVATQRTLKYKYKVSSQFHLTKTTTYYVVDFAQELRDINPKMVNNNRSRPPQRPLRERQNSEGEESDEQEDAIEESPQESGEDSEDEEDEIIIPPCPIHEARMAELRRENAELERIIAEQDRVLEEMAQRTREIKEATARKEEELKQLKAARKEAMESKEAGNDGAE